MNWVDVLKTALASSSIVAITLVVLGFISKSLFSQILSKNLESHKLKLDAEVEKLRANLERTGFEHQVRFESLHTRRAIVIDELYKLIVQLQTDVSSMARPFQQTGEPPQREKYIKANNSGRELIEYFSRKDIYFREDLCIRIDNFIIGLNEILVDFVLVIDSLEKGKIQKDSVEHWIKSWDKLTKEIVPIKSEIKQEFRKLLGIEEAS